MKMGLIFKGYLTSMAFLGRLVQSLAPHAKPTDQATGLITPHEKTLSLKEADQKATSLGMQYRALGISIGLLGIAIVFLAIAPGGLNLGHQAEVIVGGIKVFLMLLMLFIVFSGRRSRINHAWIRMRLVAEELRYGSLKTLAATVPEDVRTWQQALRVQLDDVLVGKDGQIAYNAAKARQYELIEHFADFLLWASVVLALVGAIGHLFVHWPAWIFLTAFGPAAVGGIHGINGFLGIGGLIEEHSATRSRLQQSLELLHALHPQDDADGKVLKEIAATVLEILASRDARWKEAAAKLGLKPA